MNGQDRSQARTSSSFVGSDASASNSSVTGAVKGNSWIRDMVANPDQAAQAGLISLHDHSNHRPPPLPQFDPLLRRLSSVGAQQRTSLASDFPFQDPLYKSHYNVSSLHPTPHSTAEPPQLDNVPIADPNHLLVPCVTSSNESALHHNSSKKHMNTPSSAVDPEVTAKRMKMANSYSLPRHVSQHAQQAPIPHIPHRPAYFHCGSVIQLGENRLKRIEDLQTSDFEYSASISPDLSLDSSTVIKISEDSTRGTAHLTFSVGDRSHKPLEATVEATVEHPFFVFGQGWSSVKPESTLSYYKMKSQQLKINDRCISLTMKDNSSANSNTSFGNRYGAQSVETRVSTNTTDVCQSK